LDTLKRAFEGKLVPQNPNDPPASILLEQIYAERERQNTPTQPKRNKRKSIKKYTS
jgi:type I restriction enzyme S subunit